MHLIKTDTSKLVLLTEINASNEKHIEMMRSSGGQRGGIEGGIGIGG